MKRLLLFCALSILLERPLIAQRTFYFSRPNCRVWMMHADNPIDYSHTLRQPAVLWDAEYAAVSLLAGMALRRLGAPLWVAGALPTIGFGLVPHLIGFASGRYRIDMGHWIQVLADRSTPAVWAVTQRDTAHTVRDWALWLAVETPLSCFDR